jgi:hypothetical protein
MINLIQNYSIMIYFNHHLAETMQFATISVREDVFIEYMFCL